MMQGTASIPALCCLECARLISKTLEGKDMAENKCPFCAVTASRIVAENEVAFAIPDAFPIAEGHTLVIPKRHVASLFDLSDEEQAAVSRLVAHVRAKLMADMNADGFNVGVNDGKAAGQTVMHAHVHIIPRRKGDSPDPRGGVRWIKPEKAKYWGEAEK
jgi:diadenosine tetraphosphate (Ap4A) HIT family hydrolase